MKRFVNVHAGEIMAGGEETVLKSDTNNVCLVYVAYDSVHKVGGLAHSMFLNGTLSKKWNSSILCDAEKAIDEMIDDMSLLGAEKQNITVNLVSGENVPHSEEDQDYLENIKLAAELIKKRNLKISDESVKDIGRSHVCLDVQTGELSFK